MNLPKLLSIYSLLVFAYLNSQKMEHDYNQLILALAATRRMRNFFILSRVKVAAVVGPLAKTENSYGDVIFIGFATAQLSRRF